MNRNSENHFATTPQVSMQRSTIKTPKNIKTTFNTGLLIPFYVNANVYPGETYRFNLSAVIRQSTPIHPTMDDAYADFYFFYDRKRNCWNHWNEFMGENTTGAWASSIEYTEPQIKFSYKNTNSKQGIEKGDIAHYMGLPIFAGSIDATKEISVSRLPFTSYIRIWNNFFRNQNLEAPAYEPMGDSDTMTIVKTNPGLRGWHNININTQQDIQCTPAPVNKFADYLTTCNMSAQKATSPVTLPIGSSAPILGNGNSIMITDGTATSALGNRTGNDIWLAPSNQLTNVPAGTSASVPYNSGVSDQKTIGLATTGDTGMYADLSNAVAATINAQRLAFATQRIYERDTFGTRIWEVIKNHFQTTVDEKVIGIPEYLGGFRQSLNITEIPQTSSTDSTTPQGNLAGFGHTVMSKPLFTKSFTEWGIILGLVCIRTRHSYSGAIEKQWSRKRRLDYYWPELAHIGEQPVLNKEIFATGTSTDEEVFGYQEAWADLKYERDINTGAFDPYYAQTLASWHYGDKYNSLPVLSGDWSNETLEYVDRTLAVTSAVEDQWLMSCHLDILKTTPQPLYSLPGLIDHF